MGDSTCRLQKLINDNEIASAKYRRQADRLDNGERDTNGYHDAIDAATQCEHLITVYRGRLHKQCAKNRRKRS